MASTYSTSLRLELMATGEKTNTWGTITNTNLGTLLESAIAGVASVTHDDSASYSLTTNNGSDDEARHKVIEVGGTLTADRNLVVPTAQKTYYIYNNTSGGFHITVKTSGGTGVEIRNGNKAKVYCDGTNVVWAFNQIENLRITNTTGNAGVYFEEFSQTGSDGESVWGADITLNTTANVPLIYFNITNTASGSGSSLIYAEESSVAKFNITLDGYEVQAGAGSASTPAFSFIDDSNTGMFRQAADTLGFSVGGTEVFRFDGTEFYRRVSGTNYTIKSEYETKANAATITDGNSSASVSFSNNMPNTTYAVVVTSTGSSYTDFWVTNRAVGGFDINRSGTSGNITVYWVATEYGT